MRLPVPLRPNHVSSRLARAFNQTLVWVRATPNILAPPVGKPVLHEPHSSPFHQRLVNVANIDARLRLGLTTYTEEDMNEFVARKQ